MRSRGIIIFSLLFGFVASAFLNAIQHSNAEQQKQALTSELQALQDQARSLDPETVPSPGPSAGPTTLPTVAGQSAMKISFFSVSLITTDPIADLVYGSMEGSGTPVAGFTTQTLLAKYPSCKAGALGTLIRKPAPTPSPSPSRTPSRRRSPSPTKAPANQPFNKTVAGYTYSYKAPTFICANDQAGRNDVAQAIAALKNGALPTLTPTP